MRITFIVVAILGAAYLLGARRVFDLPALAFFSACFYFVPGFVGFAGYAENLLVTPVVLETETYAVMTFVLGAIIATTVVNASFPQARVVSSAPSGHIVQLAACVAAAMGVAGLVLTILTVGPSLFAGDKYGLLDLLNRWHLLWTVSATIAVALACASHSVGLWVLSVSLLMVNVYIGFRVDLVIAVIVTAAYWLMSRGRERLLTRWRLGSGIVLTVLVLFVLKYVLVALQLMDVRLLIDQLRNPDAAKFIFLYSEPFIAQGTLNEVVRQEFWVGPEHLLDIGYLVVPFASELGAPGAGFNALFQPALFSSVTAYQLGNNIWAEMLASGGWPLLVAFVAAYCIGLLMGDHLLRQSRPVVAAPMLVVLVYWAFYIHRNDLLYQMTITRRVVLVSVAILTGAVVLAVTLSALKSLRKRQEVSDSVSSSVVRGD